MCCAMESLMGPAQGKSKTTVLNDITNTGVMAALVGGFALSSVQSGSFDHEGSDMDNVAYLMLIFAVHACTCSALTSALIYRSVNIKSDSEVPPWSIANWMILMMPMGKFGMGCASYIISVIFMSWRSLEVAPTSRAVALAIGLGSMSTGADTFESTARGIAHPMIACLLCVQ